MATNNYTLPTLESTALFDLVTDYNALANATDAALASVAGLIPTETVTEMQGKISALQTLTGSQDAQITTLQSQMSTANDNITTLQSGLVTANSNIGTLQTGLQTANTNAQSANKAIQALQRMMSPIIVLSGLSVTNSNCTVSGNVFCNPAAKILIFSMNATITYNFTNGSVPTLPSFSQTLPSEYWPKQNKRIFVGSAMSGTAACNLQLDINPENGTIKPNVGGINRVDSFKINGNAMLMYDIPNS